MACALVQAGTGIALVDEMTVKGPVWTNVVVRPVVSTISAPIHIFNASLEPLSRLAQEFIHTLENLEPLEVD